MKDTEPQINSPEYDAKILKFELENLDSRIPAAYLAIKESVQHALLALQSEANEQTVSYANDVRSEARGIKTSLDRKADAIDTYELLCQRIEEAEKRLFHDMEKLESAADEIIKLHGKEKGSQIIENIRNKHIIYTGPAGGRRLI